MDMYNKVVYGLFCSVGLASCSTINKMELALKERPNVIFIYADDMGKGMISAYGQKHFTTPNIDRLINNGTSFSNAYGCMLSAPSRASLFTGYNDCRNDKWRISAGGRYLFPYSDTAKIAKVEDIINNEDISLDKNDYYLPQIFKKAGYITAQIGKLEWGFTATRKQMREHGWDYYYGYLDHVRCHGFYPPFLFDNGEIVRIEGNNLINCGKSREPETKANYTERWDRQNKKTYSQNLFISKTLEYIRKNKDKSFFLFHSTQLPHGPVSIPKINEEIAGNSELTSIEKEYASMVKMLDDNIGMIFGELEKLNLLHKTIIIFASDNGHEIYYSQKGRCEKPYRNMKTSKLFDDYKNKYYSHLSGDIFNGNAGMAGLKRSNLEGGVHIPLTFYWKGKLPKGRVNNQLIAMYDLLPTFADFFDVRLKVQKDGASFLKSIFNDEKLDDDKYIVYSSNLGPAIINNKGWKLRYYRFKNKFELYNLRLDPQEMHNIISEKPEIADDLKNKLLKSCKGNLDNGVNKHG